MHVRGIVEDEVANTASTMLPAADEKQRILCRPIIAWLPNNEHFGRVMGSLVADTGCSDSTGD
jgi:hypothetical protein